MLSYIKSILFVTIAPVILLLCFFTNQIDLSKPLTHSVKAIIEMNILK